MNEELYKTADIQQEQKNRFAKPMTRAQKLKAIISAGNLLDAMTAHDYIRRHDDEKHAEDFDICDEFYCKTRRDAILTWRKVTEA